jgi:hypothetical protein
VPQLLEEFRRKGHGLRRRSKPCRQRTEPTEKISYLDSLPVSQY